MTATPPTFNRNLSVYQLPVELLSALTVRSIQQTSEDTAQSEPTETAPASAPVNPNALSCQTCLNATFNSVEEQRAHFKSDWHKHNARAKLRGRAVTADEWEGMMDSESGLVDRTDYSRLVHLGL
jgi:hypothetical protein